MVTLVNSSLWKKIFFFMHRKHQFLCFYLQRKFQESPSVMLLNCARLTYAVKSHCNYFGPFYLFSCDPERSHKSFSLLMISFVHIVQFCIENSLVEKKPVTFNSNTLLDAKWQFSLNTYVGDTCVTTLTIQNNNEKSFRIILNL